MDRLQQPDSCDLLLLDTAHSQGDGLEILRGMRRLQKAVPVVAICGLEDTKTRAEAARLGATKVLTRPFRGDELGLAIRGAIASPKKNPATTGADPEMFQGDDFFLSVSPLMQKVRAQAELLAQSDVPAVIVGEPGTGRATVAALIHKNSVYSGHPFQQIKCAALSRSAGVGRLELEGAGPRTLLLRELPEMPLAVQSRLLEALQQNQISVHEISPANVRIIATSSVELEEAVAENSLLEDLYTVLSAFIIRVPSLRRRRSEVEVLLRYAMFKLASHYKVTPREFSRETLQSCVNYSWPGNMRELEAFVKRYLLSGDQDLSSWDVEVTRASSVLMRGPKPAEELGKPKLSLKALIHEIKSEAERNAIADALQKTRWNRKKAARLLRVSYRTLLYKIERYQMFDSGAQNERYTGLQN
jgi:two-component system response regulator AtoC